MMRSGCTTLKININSMFYSLREAFVSLVRNGWLTLASVSIVFVSLVILGGSVLLMLNADHLAQRLESEVEISVFIEEDTKRAVVSQMEKQIKATAGVDSATFVSKEQSLREMQASFGDQRELLDNLEKNPLNDTYRIKAAEASLVPALAQSFEKLAGVEKVRYGQGLLEKLLNVTHYVRISSLGVMAVLGAATVFIIATTIRISVFSRRQEINIMKYLGATNWFVRAPFLIEGLVLGLVGALLAVAVVNYGYLALIKQLQGSIPFITLVSSGEVLNTLLMVLLGIGALIGIFGSAISIRRFLKV